MGQPVPNSTTGRNGKMPVLKKMSTTKIDQIQIMKDTTRVNFIKGFLTLHGQATQFSPGLNVGPSFKIYWTGQTYAALLFHS